MSLIDLGPLQLGLAALLVVLVAVLSWWLQLGVARAALVAGARTAIQLLLVGLVLNALFASTSLGWVAVMALVMLLVAGREVRARQRRPFRGPWGYGVGATAMFVSSFSITVLALLVVIRPDPWFTPQYAIPLLGMMLGNTMTGVALALERLTQAAWDKRQIIEARLCLGQDAHDAVSDIRRDAARAGMIPIINAMSSAGLVSLPGMMTGQILAGAPPAQAVRYQILIMFLIAGSVGVGAVGAIWLGSRRLFDERQRLRLDRLRSSS